MATLEAQTPDGKTLDIDVPEGTPEAAYPHMVDDAVGHYISTHQSGLESFGRAAVNNLPAGGQLGALGTATLGNAPDYSAGMKEWNQKAAEAKGQHPIAYGAGAVTGSLAPLAIPGVGEAMVTAPVASGAALGAANAVGNTDIVQNPGEAVKQAGEGAILGGAMGKIMPSGQQAAEGLENFANSKAVQTLGLKPGMLGIPSHELEDLGSFASSAGLTQGSLEQRVNIAKDLLQQTGAQIGDIGAGSRPLSDPSPFIEQLHSHLQESSSIFGPEANPEATVYRQGIANLSKPGITFDELQSLKTAYGQRAFDGMGNVKNDAAANVYNQIKDAMKSIINESPSDYQEAMTAYSKLKDIHNGLMNQFQQAQAGGVQAKGFGLAGKMAAMVTGGNVPATLATGTVLAPAHPFMAMGALSGITQNPQAMESAARGVAGVLPTISKTATAGGIDAVTSYLVNTLNTNPQKFGRFAQPLIQAAKQGGSQGLAAQHFLLSQQYPEYNKMTQQQEGNNDNQR